MRMHKMADRHYRGDGVVGLPWPADKRRSWGKSAVHPPRPRKSAPKHGPSRDTADTGPDNRGRTFYRVKRQLETQNRARGRERCFNPSRRRPRVLLYASFAQRASVAPADARPPSVPSGPLRERSERRLRVSITSRSKPTTFTHDSFERCEGLFLPGTSL